MKSFIAPERSVTGKDIFRIQWEGIDAAGLSKLTREANPIALAMPNRQSAEAAWLLRILFDNNHVLELSSSNTMHTGWEEIASLNVRLIDELNDAAFGGVVWSVSEISFGTILHLEKIIFEDDGIISECGLRFVGSGEKIVVCSGVPTGAVTVSA